MISRALRIFGLLLLVSGAAAAHDESRTSRRAGGRSFESSSWARQLGAGGGRHPGAARAELGHRQGRDATGRVWSNIDLAAPRMRSADGWTTRRFGSWSYSYASDGTSCVSQRTAQTVFISCQ